MTGQQLWQSRPCPLVQHILPDRLVPLPPPRSFVAGAGMQVCKIGGPCYRIGMGGGAASSRASGEADSELDFNAVQRGDAEMENKLK